MKKQFASAPATTRSRWCAALTRKTGPKRGLSSRQAQGFRPPAPHHSPQGDAEGLRAGGAGAKPNHTQIWVKLTMATNKVDGDADSTLTGCPRLDLPDLPGLELPELPQSLNPAFPDLAFQEIGAPVKKS